MHASMQMPGSRVGSKGGMLYNMTSSSLLAESGTPLNRDPNSRRGRRQAGASAHTGVLPVPTVDLAAWLHSRFCPEDDVFVKMDIEGAEFEVLQHLVASGAAALVDSLACEWHTSKRGGKAGRLKALAWQARISKGLARAGVRLTDWKM